MACSIGGWSRHPLPIGWATETRVGRPMEHRRARGSPRPAARRHARRRSLLPWQRRFVTPVRASTPGCLCFGSVGSVWSSRIYVKAARVDRSRLSKLAVALDSRNLLRLRWPTGAALSIGGRTEPGDLRQVSQEKKMWLPIEKIAVVPIPSDAHSRHRHDNPHPGQQHEDIETDRITRGPMNFCVPGAHLSTRNVLERTTGISAASYTDRCHMHRTEHCSEYVLCTDRREPQRRRSSAGPGAVRCTGHGTAVR